MMGLNQYETKRQKREKGGGKENVKEEGEITGTDSTHSGLILGIPTTRGTQVQGGEGSLINEILLGQVLRTTL